MKTQTPKKFPLEAIIFLACILLPITFFGVTYFNVAHRHIATVQKELLGLDAVDAFDQLLVDGISQEKTTVEALAADFDLVFPFEAERLPLAKRVVLLTQLYLEISTRSGLILDDNAATYFLVSATFNGLSRSLGHMATASQIVTNVEPPNAGGDIETFNLPHLISEVGAALELAEIAERDIGLSSAGVNSDAAAYDNLRTALTAFRASTEYINGLVMSSSDDVQKRALATAALAPEELALLAQSTHTFYHHAATLIRQKLAKRLQTEWVNIFLSALVGIVISLFGVGHVYHNFRQNVAAAENMNKSLRNSEMARLETQKFNLEMEKLNNELATNLRDLRAAQAELLNRSKMEHLGRLTATVAHEIRNPLAIIRTSSFHLAKKLRDEPVKYGSQLKRINNGVDRCDKIVTQLLDFSHSKSIDATSEDLDRWLKACIAEEAETLPPELRIICSFGLDGLAVTFDPTRLRRAIVNLLSNAEEAMRNKRGEAADAKLVNPTIWITTRKLPDFAMIEVKDNGPGIPESVLPNVMEPLFTTKSFGTGLGLAAVSEIARQHGGQLDVRSKFGDGASFTLALARNTEKAIDGENALQATGT